MRNYHINFDRLVNQLTPYFWRGRKTILFIQSILHPIQIINEKWKGWAEDRLIEAGTTSQIILLENYLNHCYMKYVSNKTDRFFIYDGISDGIPLFEELQNRPVSQMVLNSQDENVLHPPKLKMQDESNKDYSFSFYVYCPQVDTQLITQKELVDMVTYSVNKYRLAGKKFKVVSNEQ